MGLGNNVGESIIKSPNAIISAENEDTVVSTKKVLLYGMNGSTKVLVSVDSSGNVNTNTAVVTNPDKAVPRIYTTALTTSTVSYTQAIPSLCSSFTIKLRETSGSLKISFTAPAAPGGALVTYITIPAGGSYSEDEMALVTGILYFQSDANTVNVETVAWAKI